MGNRSTPGPMPSASYKAAGVDSRKAESALAPMFESLRQTWGGRGNVRLDLGHFANAVDLGSTSVAISTDGVGTKTIIAQLMDSYVSMGIDCVAVNVNDVLCLGARPETLVDYIAVRHVDEKMMNEIGEGLRLGAGQAGISVVGGETAQLPELIHGEGGGNGFDLAGTCIGTVEPDRIVTGASVRPGDSIIGIRSSGIHCNGLTLARKVFGISADGRGDANADALSTHFEELVCTLGEELLRPTRIYVREVLALLDSEIEVRGLAHITSDGFLNLARLEADVGYVINELPEPHAIFHLVQTRAEVPDEEMYEVFNMGIGFCVIVPEPDTEGAIQVLSQEGAEASQIGYVEEDPARAVTVTRVGLRGWRGKGFGSF